MLNEPVDIADIGWLALQNCTPETIIKTLSLERPQIVSWKRGLNAVYGDYWDNENLKNAHLSRVYITPVVRGWRFVIGAYVSLGTCLEFDETPDECQQDNLELLTSVCRELSKTCGAAHAFVTQMRMDWYGWLVCKNGEMLRRFVYDAAVKADEGAWLSAEVVSRGEISDELWEEEVFGEDIVMEIAGEVSVNLRGLTGPFESDGQGYLAVTPLGVKNGVPSRSLDNE